MTQRAPDASMSLLNELMRHPLDPGYEAAARRRRERGEPPVTADRRWLGVLAIVVIGALIGTAAVQLRGQATSGVAQRTQLVKEIDRLTAAADRLQRDNERTRTQIEQAQGDALRLQSQGGLADQVQRLGLVTGAAAVKGPGIQVTVDDAQQVKAGSADGDPRTGPATDDGRVLDRDLQMVVNGLWASGAEAIAINGQRLTALSAIRSAGEAILVDYRPLSPPYVLSVVGDSSSLQTRFASGPGGAYLASLRDNFGVRSSIHAARSLTVPASTGLRLRVAEAPPRTTTPTPSQSGSSPDTTQETHP